MHLHKRPIRPLILIVLFSIILGACEGSTSEVLAPEPDEKVVPTEPSGEAGSATLRIIRSGHTTTSENRWEVSAEFPITLYFDKAATSPLFYSKGEGIGVMSGIGEGVAMQGEWTAIFDIDFEVYGAFNAKDCSVDISVNEVWQEGAEVTFHVGGLELQGETADFVVFTTNTYEYKSLHFPYGIGDVPKHRTIGNVEWDATFSITSLTVPEYTNCGTFDYLDEADETTEIGS